MDKPYACVNGIKFGIQTPQEGVPYEVLRDHWQEAERLGYHSAWLVDHILTVALPHGNPQPDSWTTMSALAAETKKIRFGAMVLCNGFRHPPLFANSAATLDQISKGRLEFGIGAGWYQQEFEAYGYEFPKPAVRMAQLGEALEIFKAIWTQEKVSFEGKYYSVKELADSPKPYQKPHIPIWIGGAGEKLLLRLVAQHANVWNFNRLTVSEVEKKLAILHQHCTDVGRNSREIELTYYGGVFMDDDEDRLRDRLGRRAQQRNQTIEEFVKGNLWGTPQQIAEQIRAYADLGTSQFIVLFGRVSDLRGTQEFAEKVFPLFR